MKNKERNAIHRTKRKDVCSNDPPDKGTVQLNMSTVGLKTSQRDKYYIHISSTLTLDTLIPHKVLVCRPHSHKHPDKSRIRSR